MQWLCGIRVTRECRPSRQQHLHHLETSHMRTPYMSLRDFKPSLSVYIAHHHLWNSRNQATTYTTLLSRHSCVSSRTLSPSCRGLTWVWCSYLYWEVCNLNNDTHGSGLLTRNACMSITIPVIDFDPGFLYQVSSTPAYVEQIAIFIYFSLESESVWFNWSHLLLQKRNNIRLTGDTGEFSGEGLLTPQA